MWALGFFVFVRTLTWFSIIKEKISKSLFILTSVGFFGFQKAFALMQQMGIIMLQVEQAVTHLEQTPDVLGVCEELSLWDLSFPQEAAGSWRQLCAGGAHNMLWFAASAASDLGQSRDFQKSMSKAGAQTHCKSMCVQVSGCDHSQAIALLRRIGKDHI